MSHQSDLISQDIHAYLAQHERKELLRFLTCGNVDDGKSTLIGRLLHDSKMIYEDHLEAITRDSKKSGTTGDEVDLALLVDGLQAEREQGITIDVAYRYFSTAKRKFIIADTPGHEQYTRNMATGASTCDLAIILIDARPQVPPPVIWPSSLSTPAMACRPRPAGTALSPRYWGSSTSWWRSTRWI
jgi:bifunctional enzyme CysN/CysC